MKSFTAIVSAVLFAVAVSAMPATVDTLAARGGDKCNTGPVQCCNSMSKAGDEGTTKILHSLNIKDVAKDITVGLTCSPVNVIGIGSNSCNAQPVCCENNNFNGVVAIGCTPININV
ncbi:hydrophobin-251 [Flagelloscypha sp. PMI_526]|nr:hydrophobin-251 [Flagelloscypha sp. PMI_526]